MARLKPGPEKRTLDQLVGGLGSARPVALSPLDRLAQIESRMARLEAPNLYQRDLSRFRTTCCFTRNEAAGGKVALIPDFPYLREVDDAFLSHTPLMIEKSRRMLISWSAMAFALWVLAGGQDERWPALMNSTENRKVVLASRKLEGENGSAEMLNERLRFLVDQFEDRGLRKNWPDFPTFKWRFDRAVASNGSVCAAVPSGPDQLRGSGITLLIMDEIAFWVDCKASVASALQTLTGGGHALLISTANAASWAAQIAAGKVRPAQMMNM